MEPLSTATIFVALLLIAVHSARITQYIRTPLKWGNILTTTKKAWKGPSNMEIDNQEYVANAKKKKFDLEGAIIALK